MKIKKILEGIVTISVKGSELCNITHIHYDSRKIKKNGLFVAIKGEHFDGHKFIEQAKKNGARAVIVEKEIRDPHLTVIRVNNTRHILAHLSKNFFGDPSQKVSLIGVTGTNGKTTTTYLLESILKVARFRPAVLGTINYRFGKKVWGAHHTTPESIDLQEMFYNFQKKKATHVVMEVSSHALALGRVEGLHFNVAIFTNLTRDHLDFHETFESYFDAKKSLFTKVLPASLKRRKACIINIDDEYGKKLAAIMKQGVVITYGFSKEADFRVENVHMSLEGMKGTLITRGDQVSFSSRLVGNYNVSNILGASACMSHLGVPLPTILKGIEKLEAVPGRLERVVLKKGRAERPMVFVDYAHTDDALKNVLGAIRALKPQGKVITVFGCGGDRDKTKRPLMGKIAAKLSDCVVVTSDNPRTEDPLKIIEDIQKGLPQNKNIFIEPDRKKAIFAAVKMAKPKDVILIAGKGHETYQILGSRVIDFDDRKKAWQALKKFWS